MQKPKASQEKFLASSALVYGAICWGIIWYPYRLLSDVGIAGVESSLFSYLIAIVMGAVLFWRRAKHISEIPFSAYSLSIVAGWTNLSYVLAIIDGEVMRVMLLFYLSPLWTLLLARVWLKERWTRPQLLAIGLSLIGAWIMLTKGQWVWPWPESRSDWLALSAGIGFSMTNVMTRHATHLSVAAKSMLVWVGVFLLSMLIIGLQHKFTVTFALDALHEVNAWLNLTVIACMLVSATLLVQYGVTKIPAIQASVLFMFELIVAAVAAYFLAHEVMSLTDVIGGLCIILAGVISVMHSPEAA